MVVRAAHPDSIPSVKAEGLLCKNERIFKIEASIYGSNSKDDNEWNINFLKLKSFILAWIKLFHLFFKKMGQSRPLFVCFCYFLDTISIIQIEKSLDGVLGIRTRGRRMVGTDETTELVRPPIYCIYY